LILFIDQGPYFMHIQDEETRVGGIGQLSQ